MATDPVRRIGRLATTLTLFGGGISSEMRATLERVAHTCPVHKSLHPDVEIPVTFAWGVN
jgi:putative redox protein